MPSAACRNIALVGETEHDVREVMIEGAVRPPARVAARASGRSGLPTRRRLEWPNGAVAQAFSADDPEQLARAAIRRRLVRRARQVALCRSDASTCCSSACGLAQRPRQLITTTPRPIALIKRLIADPRTAVTRAATHANAAHLSPAFLDEVLARYAGTRLGRQEIDGEIIEDRPDALWSRAMIEACRVAAAPPLRAHRGRHRSAGLGARRGSDACGIVAAGPRRGRHDLCAGGRDRRRASRPPAGRAQAIALYRRLDADTLVAEVNQGGDMVRAVLRQVDRAVPLQDRARDARQMAARRAGRGDVRAGQVKHVDRRCRSWKTRCATSASRAFVGRLARPARRAGVGGYRSHEARHRAADYGALATG